MQAGILITALARQRPLELGEAFADAWNVGPKWREHLESGIARLDEATQATLGVVLLRWQGTRRAKSRLLAEPLPSPVDVLL